MSVVSQHCQQFTHLTDTITDWRKSETQPITIIQLPHARLYHPELCEITGTVEPACDWADETQWRYWGKVEWDCREVKCAVECIEGTDE